MHGQRYGKEAKCRLLHAFMSLTFLILEVNVGGDDMVTVIHVNDVEVSMVLAKATVFLLCNLWTALSKARAIATRIYVEIHI